MLEGLLHDKLPRLAEHLDAIKCDLKTLATDWFLCAFARSLPAETTCRVWDALYAEGGKQTRTISRRLGDTKLKH